MPHISHLLSGSSMQCTRPRELEYPTEGMASCRMKMLAVHCLHATCQWQWVLVKLPGLKNCNVHATASSTTQHASTCHRTGQAP